VQYIKETDINFTNFRER